MTQSTSHAATGASDLLRTGAAVRLAPSAGVLILRDADRVDFLQRMTTNNIKALRDGQACVTVLTSPTAKIIQVFTVLARTDELWLLPAPGETAALERHLRGQIFFMDKVKVANVSGDYTRLRVIGARADAALTALGVGATELRDGDMRQAGDLVVLAQQQYDLPGYELILPAAGRDDAIARLGLPITDDAACLVRRIELGRPAPGAEITGEYSPLEAGLAWACAENKGCYTGQEIIARQITYDKVTRQLVGLRGNTALTADSAVTADGHRIGAVTSSAYSPALQAHIALAILKRTHTAPGTAVNVGEAAAVVVTPFDEPI